MLHQWLRRHETGNPCLVLPTGSGKSHIIAAYCQREIKRCPDARMLMLTHQKELIMQDLQKLVLAWPLAPVGVYSSSLKSHEVNQITFAGIQSVWRHAADLGRTDIVLIDEAHLVNHEDTGMYRRFLDDLRPSVVIGLTATPYRLGHGLITDKPALFDDLIEPVSIKELISQGYLSRLSSKTTSTRFNLDNVGRRGGDYIESELQRALDVPATSEAVVDEVLRRADGRKHWLFFCSGVEHARHVCDILKSRGVSAACVTGRTPAAERDELLSDYKEGCIRCLTNANLLTTGFDFPGLDLIVMMRPTLSPGLYMQMAGRGLRTASGKKDCLVLDFAGNVALHGPITDVRLRPPRRESHGEGVAPSKTCPECDEIVPASCRACPECGHEFRLSEMEEFRLRYEDIMGDEDSIMPVKGWIWSIHYKRETEEPMLKVTYLGRICDDPISEYLKIWCPKYFQFKQAWQRFAAIACQAGIAAYPQDPDDLVLALNAAPPPVAVTYRKENGFARVHEHIWPGRMEVV